jgi:chromate transporter
MITEWIHLFISFFKVGSLSFGGAYSLIPIIENEVVKNHHWLTGDEFLKILGMVEIFPGAISIKYATYTGYKVAGIPGVIMANLGNMIMPAVIIILATYFYNQFSKYANFKKAFEGIKFVMIGMIVAVMLQYTIKGTTNLKSLIFITLGFCLIYFYKLHPAVAIVAGGILALFIL